MQLSWRMQARAELAAFEALDELDMKQLDIGEPGATTNVRESLFAFDDDKVLAVSVVSDDVTAYDPEHRLPSVNGEARPEHPEHPGEGSIVVAAGAHAWHRSHAPGAAGIGW